MDIVDIARQSGMTVVLEARIGRQEYHSVHGSLAKAPLKNRQAPAYRALEDWVRLTLASNPTLHDPAGSSSEARAPAAAKTEEPFAADSSQSVEPMPTSTANPMPAPGATPSKPAAADPFDPSIFNRQAHPEKQTAPAKKP